MPSLTRLPNSTPDLVQHSQHPSGCTPAVQPVAYPSAAGTPRVSRPDAVGRSPDSIWLRSRCLRAAGVPGGLPRRYGTPLGYGAPGRDQNSRLSTCPRACGVQIQLRLRCTGENYYKPTKIHNVRNSVRAFAYNSACLQVGSND